MACNSASSNRGSSVLLYFLKSERLWELDEEGAHTAGATVTEW